MSDKAKELLVAKLALVSIAAAYWWNVDGNYYQYYKTLPTFLSSEENKKVFIDRMSNLISGNFDDNERKWIVEVCSLFVEAILKNSSLAETELLNFFTKFNDS